MIDAGGITGQEHDHGVELALPAESPKWAVLSVLSELSEEGQLQVFGIPAVIRQKQVECVSLACGRCKIFFGRRRGAVAPVILEGDG